MNSHQKFARRIQERYPEGLTGVFAIGGTRTTYILEQNRDKDDPGKIEDFAEQSEYLLGRYLDFAEIFYSLGGQNMIITAFSFRGFYNRGTEYAQYVSEEMLRLISPKALNAYQNLGIDPYFVGIDTLKLLPEEHPAYHLGVQLTEFQQNWDYQDGRRKLIWEIASIPLFSMWQIDLLTKPEKHQTLHAEIEESSDDLETVYRHLYKYYAREIYGTDIPMPHFYLGTNKSGDLKWRSPLPLTLSGGDYLRMFFTPYPSLFITRDVMQTILEDLAFGKRFFSDKTDYKGKYTRELVEAEYQRVMQLRQDSNNVLGLARRVVENAD